MAYDNAGNELDSPAGEPTLGGPAAARYSPRNLVESQLLRTYDRCFEEYGSACIQPDPAEAWQSNVYDGRGVRVLSSRIVVSGGISEDPPPPNVYFYTPELAMLNVVAPSTGRTADVIWFGSRPVADHGQSELRYTFTDHLGTPILQTTPSRTVTWQAEYEPFGSVYALRTGAANDDQPLRFPGQQVSYSTSGGEESYNIYRWYRGGWGRYTQVDPLNVGLMAAGNALPQYAGMYTDRELRHRMYVPQFEQTYGYAVNNPLGAIDPSGLDAATTIGQLCTKAPHPLVKAAGYVILALAAANAVDQTPDQPKKCTDCEQKKCLPCDPPLGTLSYRTDSAPHAGMTGLHIHIYQMHQSPPKAGCKCFWHEVGHPYQPPVPPAGAIPIRPAGGGGVG